MEVYHLNLDILLSAVIQRLIVLVNTMLVIYVVLLDKLILSIAMMVEMIVAIQFIDQCIDPTLRIRGIRCLRTP